MIYSYQGVCSLHDLQPACVQTSHDLRHCPILTFSNQSAFLSVIMFLPEEKARSDGVEVSEMAR